MTAAATAYTHLDLKGVREIHGCEKSPPYREIKPGRIIKIGESEKITEEEIPDN